jgi:hypothetical protein
MAAATVETTAHWDPQPRRAQATADMDLQPVEADIPPVSLGTTVDSDAWKTMQFAWLDSVRSKPAILSGLELADRVNELLSNDASVYLASPATS